MEADVHRLGNRVRLCDGNHTGQDPCCATREYGLGRFGHAKSQRGASLVMSTVDDGDVLVESSRRRHLSGDRADPCATRSNLRHPLRCNIEQASQLFTPFAGTDVEQRHARGA